MRVGRKIMVTYFYRPGDFMRFFSDLRLATKIVLLVALLGALALFVVLNLITTMRSLEQDYRALNIRHNATSQHLDNA